MRLNHQFCTTFQGLNLNLEELLGKYAAREYAYRNLVEYDILNYSICVPDHLNTMTNCDGYEFIAYEANQYHDYSIAPLTVTISSQRLNDASFQTKTDKLAFLKRMVGIMQHQFSIKTMTEAMIDGYPAVIIEQAMSTAGSQTYAMLISNQCLTQISVSLHGNFTNAREITHAIVTSFKVNSTPSPQNASLTTMENHHEVFELEEEYRLKESVQYVISPSHTEPVDNFYIQIKDLKRDTQSSVAFLGCDDLIDLMFCTWGNTVNHLARLMIEADQKEEY